MWSCASEWPLALELASCCEGVGSDVGLLCSDGVGRTGAFIATHAEMERMKAETVVDLFQFIKAIRLQRHGMVSNTVRKG